VHLRRLPRLSAVYRCAPGARHAALGKIHKEIRETMEKNQKIKRTENIFGFSL
jgi:hypothetical protein